MEDNALVFDLGGHCFLCLEIPPKDVTLVPGKEAGKATYSLRNIYHYTRISVGKVLKSKYNINDPALIKVADKCPPTVSLCGECALLTEKFSGWYRQLERVQMEVDACLRLVYGKLLLGNEADRQEHFFQNRTRTLDNGERDFYEEVRKEAIAKCSAKLANTLPRAVVPKASVDVFTSTLAHGPNTASSDDVGSGLVVVKQNNSKRENSGTPKSLLLDTTYEGKKIERKRDGPGDYASMHYKFDPESRKFCCKVCGVSLLTKHSFQKHYTIFHGNLSRFECSICGKKFSFKCQLQKHLSLRKSCQLGETSSNWRPRELTRNKEYLESEKKLEDHSSPLVTSEVKFGGEDDKSDKCESEEPIFAEERCLPEVINEIENTSVSVPKIMSAETRVEPRRWSPSDTVVVQVADAHLSSEGNQALIVTSSRYKHFSFNCQICGKAFRTNGLLSRHHKVVHLKMKELPCKVCTKLFLNSVQLNIHEAKCLASRQASKFLCKICGKGFLLAEKLENHQYHVHERPPKVKKIFYCDLCKKSFYHPSNLRIHKEFVHLGVKWKCSEDCGKVYSTKYNLEGHRKICPFLSQQQTRQTAKAIKIESDERD